MVDVWIKYRPSPSGTAIKFLMLGSKVFSHVKKRPCGSPPSDKFFTVYHHWYKTNVSATVFVNPQFSLTIFSQGLSHHLVNSR